ncbi:MAG TPA: T9SS type A sorting domain-containing protein, partial [Chitinophagaceae bacterium]|nr:T9SS type A sorting domain-containing protein [Chitinophagaceae bacterium]
LLYRLKQIDIDGNFKYSNIIRIISKATTDITSYPNPFTSQVNLSISSSTNQQVTASLYDATGKKVSSEIKNLYAGSNSFALTGPYRLTTGMYYLEIKDINGELLARTKLVKN